MAQTQQKKIAIPFPATFDWSDGYDPSYIDEKSLTYQMASFISENFELWCLNRPTQKILSFRCQGHVYIFFNIAESWNIYEIFPTTSEVNKAHYPSTHGLVAKISQKKRFPDLFEKKEIGGALSELEKILRLKGMEIMTPTPVQNINLVQVRKQVIMVQTINGSSQHVIKYDVVTSIFDDRQWVIYNDRSPYTVDRTESLETYFSML
jgi:hypothetical protein